jgi:hypothetical protein
MSLIALLAVAAVPADGGPITFVETDTSVVSTFLLWVFVSGSRGRETEFYQHPLV